MGVFFEILKFKILDFGFVRRGTVAYRIVRSVHKLTVFFNIFWYRNIVFQQKKVSITLYIIYRKELRYYIYYSIAEEKL